MSSSKTTKLAVAAAATGSLAQVAGAAIHTADFSSSPITVSGLSGIFIDFSAVSATTTSTPEQDASVLFLGGIAEKPVVNSFNGWSAAISGNYASKLAFNATIDTSSLSTSRYLENGDAGTWNTPNDGQGYLGFSNTDGNQAWALIDYNDDTNTISLLGLGYNDSGTLTAGQTSAIPEPASAAALAALLAGGAAAFRRRRAA